MDEEKKKLLTQVLALRKENRELRHKMNDYEIPFSKGELRFISTCLSDYNSALNENYGPNTEVYKKMVRNRKDKIKYIMAKILEIEECIC